MAHIKLHLVMKVHPRNSRMRKRLRRLKPIRPSRAVELWYKAELLKLVRLLRTEAVSTLYPILKSWSSANGKFVGDAKLPPSVQQGFESMGRKFGGIDNVAKRLADTAAKRNLGAVDKRLIDSVRKSVGVDITSTLTTDGAIREAMVEAMTANVELITSIPEQFFDKLEKNLMERLVSGVRFEDLADELEHTLDVTESRAKLIARDQTSKMNSSFNEARQTSIGIDKYEWQTAGDERVRETHAENDGKVFSWDDPPEETGHPGEDINCRCVAVPFFDLDAEEEALG